jgi:gamma-glutamyl-gamma-aminobutyrate hydrolase PuuD
MKKTAFLLSRITENSNYFEQRISLDLNWGRFFSKIENVEVFTSFPNSLQMLDDLKPSVVILSGGNSLNNMTEIDEIRMEQDSKALEYAISKGIPVLGVCYGAQLINSYFGGKLKSVTGHVVKKHKLIKTNHHFLFKDYAAEIEVNSYHDSAIDRLGSELLSIYNDENGNSEAFVHKSSKICGIMWHPERETPFADRDIQLINRIVRNL